MTVFYAYYDIDPSGLTFPPPVPRLSTDSHVEYENLGRVVCVWDQDQILLFVASLLITMCTKAGGGQCLKKINTPE